MRDRARKVFTLMAALLAAAGPAVGEPWVLAEGRLEIRFNAHLLEDLGLEILQRDGDGAIWTGAELSLATSPESPAPRRGFDPWPGGGARDETAGLEIAAPGGSFAGVEAGVLRFPGGFDLAWPGGYLPVDGVTLGRSLAPFAFSLRAAGGLELLELDHPHARFLAPSREFVFLNMDARVSRPLARLLGRPGLEGVTVGVGRLAARVAGAGEGDSEPACTPDFAGDVDVELTAITGLSEVAHDATRVAVSPAVWLRNSGAADVEWFQAIAPDAYLGHSTVGRHPYLAVHLYRLADGRLRQLGRADVKHAFFAANSGCGCQADQVLFVGCSDLYGVTTNANRDRLAPRDEVTASSGDWESLGSHFDGEPVNDYRDHGEADHLDPFEHRLTVAAADLTTPGAEYLVEAWYPARGDIDLFNSMGYRRVLPTPGGAWTFPFQDTALTLGPALDAWVDPAAPGADASSTSIDTGEGHLGLAVRTGPLEDGFHHYEIALMNLDFDRQIGSLSIDLPAGAVVRNAVFADVDSDPGNDWQLAAGPGAVAWSAGGGGPPGNGLDWGTLFNFAFDANVPPADGAMTLGILESGPGASLQAAARAPGATAIPVFLVSVEVSGEGVVASAPGGIDCGADCSEHFVEDRDVVLAADAAPGHQLSEWREEGAAVSESARLELAANRDHALEAIFDPCPQRRFLTGPLLDEPTLVETCHVLETAGELLITAAAGVTFRAGEAIRLTDWWGIASGAEWSADLDPALTE